MLTLKVFRPIIRLFQYFFQISGFAFIFNSALLGVYYMLMHFLHLGVFGDRIIVGLHCVLIFFAGLSCSIIGILFGFAGDRLREDRAEAEAEAEKAKILKILNEEK